MCSKAKVIKAIIYSILLVLFYFLYMDKTIQNFVAHRTNFARSDVKIPEDGIEMPTMSFCFKPLFKPSMKTFHDISTNFCIAPTNTKVVERKKLDSVLTNANMTLNKFCTNISYQLNRDFTLKIGRSNILFKFSSLDGGN